MRGTVAWTAFSLGHAEREMPAGIKVSPFSGKPIGSKSWHLLSLPSLLVVGRDSDQGEEEHPTAGNQSHKQSGSQLGKQIQQCSSPVCPCVLWKYFPLQKDIKWMFYCLCSVVGFFSPISIRKYFYKKGRSLWY